PVLGILVCPPWSLRGFERWAGPGGRGGEGRAGPPRAPHWRGGTNSGYPWRWAPDFGERIASIVASPAQVTTVALSMSPVTFASFEMANARTANATAAMTAVRMIFA